MNITIEALVDGIPEYNEEFTLLLTNITGMNYMLFTNSADVNI